MEKKLIVRCTLGIVGKKVTIIIFRKSELWDKKIAIMFVIYFYSMAKTDFHITVTRCKSSKRRK